MGMRMGIPIGGDGRVERMFHAGVERCHCQRRFKRRRVETIVLGAGKIVMYLFGTGYGNPVL